MVACEEPSQQSGASVKVTPESVDIIAEGGEAEVTFTTEGGNGSKVTVKEDASWLDAKVNGSVINLTATANTTANVREVVVTVKYESAEATFTVKQTGSEYDVVFNAKRFEGIYFGTEYSAMHNYYIILSDVGVKTDASAKANGKYYLTYACGWPEKLAYAMSDSINGPWEFKGLLSECAGNCNTTHPSIVELNGKTYMFTHNGTLPEGTSYSRSVTVEEIKYNPDGTMQKCDVTTKGINGKGW